MTKEEIIAGLKAGRKLRCDRRDEPLLSFLMENPNISNVLVQVDDQSSYIEFSWKGV